MNQVVPITNDPVQQVATALRRMLSKLVAQDIVSPADRAEIERIKSVLTDEDKLMALTIAKLEAEAGQRMARHAAGYSKPGGPKAVRGGGCRSDLRNRALRWAADRNDWFKRADLVEAMNMGESTGHEVMVFLSTRGLVDKDPRGKYTAYKVSKLGVQQRDVEDLHQLKKINQSPGEERTKKNEIFALRYVEKNDGALSSDIMRDTGWARGTSSRMLTRLEQRGLITREGSSSTHRPSHITDAGRVLLAEWAGRNVSIGRGHA